MELVRPDLAEEAVDAARVAVEWPQYAKFVYVQSVDLAIVGASQSFWHLELLRLIQQHVESVTGVTFALSDEDVFLGFVEWDDDGSMRLRTTSRPRDGALPQSVENELLAALQP